MFAGNTTTGNSEGETSPHVHTINNEPLGLLLLCKMASVFAGNTTTGNSEGG
jgi:hypothetical protein